MGKEAFGYAGKLIRVHLSSGQISFEPTLTYAREWLGGMGIGQWILYSEVKKGVTPYAPVNVLTFGAGPLVGTLAPGAVRLSAESMNGLTLGVGNSNCCGKFASTLKYAGFDHIVIRGKARKPVYLWIDDDKIELRDASHLWGKTTWETENSIRDELGDPRIQTLSIGPAGENLVRGAAIIAAKNRAFGRCGLGAVMGSKNLKAVAVRGTGSVRVAQPDRFMKAVDKSTHLFALSEKAKALRKYGSLRAWDAKQAACGLPYRNFQELIVPEEMLKKLNPEQYVEKFMVGNRSTLNCPVACDRYLIVNEGPHAGLECSNIQFIALGEFAARLAVEDITSILKINVLCNKLGVDIDLAAGVIGWAMECYQRGILTDKDTDGLKLEWGDSDVIIDLIEKIAHRQGIGDLLAEGCSYAARNFGRGSDYYAMHMKGQDLYEITRGSVGWGLAASVATRGGGHTTGALPCDTESGGGSDFDKINRVIGIETADKPLAYEGKAKEVKYMEQFSRVCSSLGFCLYTTFWYDAPLTGLEDMAELYSAATGYETTEEELKRKAERILNVEKAFNLIHTSFDRKDDYPPQREFDEPIPSGSKKGWKLEREKWDALLDEYYGLHRWEKETSYPTRSCLQDLDLEVIADDLEKIGKLGKEV